MIALIQKVLFDYFKIRKTFNNWYIVVSSHSATTQIPDVVRNFILHFYRNVIDNNVYELHSIYDNSFNKITEKFYQKQAWPEADVIAPLVNEGNPDPIS